MNRRTFRTSRVTHRAFGAVVAGILLATVCVFGGAASAQDAFVPDPRIIGGTQVSDGDLPFTGYMISGPVYCGSTLIDPIWMLTAAHCVDGSTTPSDVRFAVGRTTVTEAGVGEIRDAREIIIHPDYNPANLRNDLALVRIDPITTIEPVALGTSGEASRWAPGTLATVAGWGRTSPDGSGTATLRSARVPVISDTDCRARDVGPGLTPDIQICAGTASEDACNGDSGGPLFVRRPNGDPVQFGIVSWGLECATSNSAGVYVQVDAYADWIGGIAFVGAVPGLSVETTCVGGNGLVAATVTNTGATTATIEVEFGALIRTATVNAGNTARLAVSGRPDGSLAVTANNAGGTTSRTVTVDCDPPADEVTTSQRCLSGNGFITVVVTNVTSSTQNYSVSIDGLGPRTSTLGPDDSVTVRVSGRPDKDVPVSVRRGAVTLPTISVPVDCDPNPSTEVTITKSCLAGNGRIDVTLANITTSTTANYSVTIDSLDARTRSVTPGQSTIISATGRPDGEIDVVVERNGANLVTTTRTISC